VQKAFVFAEWPAESAGFRQEVGEGRKSVLGGFSLCKVFDLMVADHLFSFATPAVSRSKSPKAKLCRLTSSILRRTLFAAIDDDHIHGAFARFQLQAKLILQGREDAGPRLASLDGGTAPALRSRRRRGQA